MGIYLSALETTMARLAARLKTRPSAPLTLDHLEKRVLLDGLLPTLAGDPVEYEYALGSGGSLVVTDTVPDRDGQVTIETPTEIDFDGHVYNVIMGTTGHDALTGTEADDVILGFEGNDTVYAGAGGDVVVGGAGNDVLHGEDGDDVFVASSGWDKYFGGDGSDTLDATQLAPVLYGYSGDQTVENVLGDGSTILYGTTGHDTLDFSGTVLTGIALIDGGVGNDTITGSAGDDTITGSAGNDILYGGGGG